MIEEIQRQSEALAPRFDGYRRRALVIGLIGIAATVFGYLADHQQFFQSYLLAFIYWVCLPLGCLGILMIVKVSAVGILFPLFIAMLVPVRLLLNRFFTEEHLKALDADEIPEDEEDQW